MRNNDVYQTLVTKGNQEVLGAGQRVTDLKPGQIGVFDFESGKSISGTPVVRNFFLAVGLDTTGEGEITDIRKSAGSHIQGRNAVYYSVRPYQEAKPQVIDITNFCAKCDETYGLAVELQNENISRTIGDNRFKLTFLADADCCNSCGTCEKADTNKLVKKFYDSIKNNSKGLLRVELIDNSGEVVPDYDAFIEENKAVNEDDDASNDVTLGLRITTVPDKIRKYCGINLNYVSVRNTFIKVYPTQGFECCDLKITVKQEAQVEQGSGYDVRHLEYVSGGWNENPGPYRMDCGIPRGVDYYADSNGKYTMVALTYDQFSISGWLEYLSNEATVIAIPKDDTTTLNGLLSILDKLLKPYNFDELSDDAQGYDKESNKTEGIADAGEA